MRLFDHSGQASVTDKSVLKALSAIIDPDLGQDIVTLGFVKNMTIASGVVGFDIELTTPACPVKDQFKEAAERLVGSIPGVDRVNVRMTARTRASVAVDDGALRRSLGGVRHLIAVASGKGGVAKSTTAVSVASALRATGAKVGILDADVYGPSIPKMLGVAARPTMADGMIVPPTSSSGIAVISSEMFLAANEAAVMRGPMVSGVIRQFLTDVAWGDLDYLIVDFPPGTGDIQLTLGQTAPITGAVIVTTPQEVSLIDVRKAMTMFARLNVPILGVIETMSYFVCGHCDTEHALFGSGGGARVASEFGVPMLGRVPLDPALGASADAGRAHVDVAPTSPGSVAYREAASRVAAETSKLAHGRSVGPARFAFQWGTDREVTSGLDLRAMRRVDDRSIAMSWADGSTSVWDVVELRRACPCAECVDEWSGRRTLDPGSVDEATRPVTITTVGRYALTIEFSDGHRTGIYSFKQLARTSG